MAEGGVAAGRPVVAGGSEAERLGKRRALRLAAELLVRSLGAVLQLLVLGVLRGLLGAGCRGRLGRRLAFGAGSVQVVQREEGGNAVLAGYTRRAAGRVAQGVGACSGWQSMVRWG